MRGVGKVVRKVKLIKQVKFLMGNIAKSNKKINIVKSANEKCLLNIYSIILYNSCYKIDSELP